MKRRVLILHLIGILCFTGKYTFAQISEGGTPISFSLDTDTGREKIPVVSTPRVDARSLIEEDERQRAQDALIPFRFGKAIDVDIDIKKAGMKIELPGGDKLWLMKIHCPDAFSINLIYDRFRLAEGAKFFIYNEDRTMILGAFTPEVSNNTDNVFATDLVQGNTIVLEYFEPSSSDDGIIHIGKVIHGYINTFGDSRGLNESGKCHNDVICQQWNNWINERRAVTMLLVNDNSSFGTGCLVNNTKQDYKPYILTAYHCYFNNDGSERQKPATSIFRFFYWKPNCAAGSSTATGTPAGFKSITGAEIKASYVSSDFTLLELKSSPPSDWNVYYAGWDRTTPPAPKFTGIHHPKGDAMKISETNRAATIEAFSPTMGGTPVDCWGIIWDSGVTEELSSGSPLFDASKRIIGQLTAGKSNCDKKYEKDYYGRFDVSWDRQGATSSTERLYDWLDPLGNTAQYLNGAYAPSITGPDIFCGGTVFSISTGQSATWSVPSGFSLSTTTGSSTTVTPTVYNGQSATLTAVLNNGYTIKKTIKACSLVVPTTQPCPSATYSIDSGQSATWSVTSGFSRTPATGASTSVSTSSPTLYNGTLTAVVNGVTFTKSIQPCPVIIGPSKVCKTGAAELFSLANGQAINWIVAPSNIFSIVSSTATTVYVTSNSSNGEEGVVIAVLGTTGASTKPITASCAKSGGNDTDLDVYLTVYPNPTSGLLNIEIDASAHTLDLQSKSITTVPAYDVRLYDGQGNLQRQASTKGGNVQFDLSNLSNGIYYLLVQDGESIPATRQVVVEH